FLNLPATSQGEKTSRDVDDSKLKPLICSSFITFCEFGCKEAGQLINMALQIGAEVLCSLLQLVLKGSGLSFQLLAHLLGLRLHQITQGTQFLARTVLGLAEFACVSVDTALHIICILLHHGLQLLEVLGTALLGIGHVCLQFSGQELKVFAQLTSSVVGVRSQLGLEVVGVGVELGHGICNQGAAKEDLVRIYISVQPFIVHLSAQLRALDVLHHTVSMRVELSNILPETIHHLLPSGLRGIRQEQATSLAACEGRKSTRKEDLLLTSKNCQSKENHKRPHVDGPTEHLRKEETICLSWLSRVVCVSPALDEFLRVERGSLAALLYRPGTVDLCHVTLFVRASRIIIIIMHVSPAARSKCAKSASFERVSQPLCYSHGTGKRRTSLITCDLIPPPQSSLASCPNLSLSAGSASGLQAAGVFSVGGEALLDHLGSLSNLRLEILSQRRLQLSLQVLRALLQVPSQLLALLEQGGLQGLRIQGVGVRSHGCSELLHSLLDLAPHVVGKGLQLLSHGDQVLTQTLPQHFGLLGDFVHELLSQRVHLLLEGDGVFSVGSEALLDHLGSLSNLRLEILSQRSHGLLKLLQTQVNLLSDLGSVRLQLSLQVLRALLQVPSQLLALLEQGGLQGLRIQGVSVRSHGCSELLHSLLDLAPHVVGKGLQLLSHGDQVLTQTLPQHFGLLGDFVHELLSQRVHLLLEGDGVFAGHIGALGQSSAARRRKRLELPPETLENIGAQVNCGNLLDFLSQLGLSDHLDGFIRGLRRLGNIAPEGITQLLQLWLGLVGMEEVGPATCR
ncbi:hypothetical protein DNTS_014255, partial [Danionella cerebrum]